MIGKERVVGVLGSAVIVAVVMGGLPLQLFAPTAEPQLVSYVVTWHATARGSGHRTWPSGETEGGLTHFAEMRGYAIVRFEQPTDGRPALMMYDTRYISVSAVDSWQGWRVSHWQMGAKPGPSFECPSCVEVKPHSCTESAYSSSDITDPSENSGLYIRTRDLNHQLLGDWRKRPDGVVVFPWAFAALGYLEFTHHATTFVQESAGCGQAERRDISYKSSPGGALLTPPAELRQLDEKYALALPAVNAKDDSSFAMNVRFSDTISGEFSVGGTDQVEWTAEAHRLGTCPCALNSTNAALPASGLAWASSPATSPINISADDPAIVSGNVKEVVDVWLQDHQIDPNGTVRKPKGSTAHIAGTPVKVRVTTCDGIPVKKAEVQVWVDAEKFSGGHNHENPSRPHGWLNGVEIVDKDPGYQGGCVYPLSGQQWCLDLVTDENGYAWDPSFKDAPARTIRFQPPYAGTDWGAKYGAYDAGVAGTYEITARTVRRKGNEVFYDSKASDSVTAAVQGLAMMRPDPKNYKLERGGTNSHPYGFYATGGTADAFKKLAADFLDAQNEHNVRLKTCLQEWPVKLASINDIALGNEHEPTGGIFDWHNTWHPSHQTHNKGEGGDFNRFTDISDDQKVLECFAVPPKGRFGITMPVPLRSVLLHTLLEFGKKYGHWDCSDLGADVPVGPEVPITSNECEAGEFPKSLFPFQNWTTLHLHVED